MRTYKALGLILADHSHTCRVLMLITMPRHAQPSEASECTHVLLSFSSPPHYCKYTESNPLFK
jgi:hypothetical protein